MCNKGAYGWCQNKQITSVLFFIIFAGHFLLWVLPQHSWTVSFITNKDLNIWKWKKFWRARLSCNISHMRGSVSLHFQTWRRKLKIQYICWVYFDKLWGVCKCNEINVLSWVFDISLQSKLKLRRKLRNEMVKIYAN